MRFQLKNYTGRIFFLLLMREILTSKSSTMETKNIILSTTHYITGYETIEMLGICRGSTVRARNVGRDFLAGLKNLVGGEIEEYTKLLATSREQALQTDA
jgi:hypothetical protein